MSNIAPDDRRCLHKRTKTPPIWRFYRRYAHGKMLLVAAPDKRDCLALFAHQGIGISHRPIHPTRNGLPRQIKKVKPFIKMIKNVLLLIYEGILTPTQDHDNISDTKKGAAPPRVAPFSVLPTSPLQEETSL